MRGIVGYARSESAVSIIVASLKKPEYRRYDSVGVVICGEKGFDVVKQKGCLATLGEHHKRRSIKTCMSIGQATKRTPRICKGE
jgi:glucosamine 6-phosphate synthetase-like amidotransferase/phosphosugar isomerase protein